jgi:hypothetical protein
VFIFCLFFLFLFVFNTTAVSLENNGFFNFFYSYVHAMFGSFLPPSPHPLPYTPPYLSIPGRNYSALISNFVEERV